MIDDRLLSRKTVTFSFSEPYDFIPSILASLEASTSLTPTSLCDAKSESIKWCRLVYHLRTHFTKKSVLNEGQNPTVEGIPAPVPAAGTPPE
jgi:hypothetical protein